MSKITESGIDLRQFLFKLVSKWYLYAISLALGVGYAYYTVKNSPLIYAFESTILVETRESGSKKAGELLNVIKELDNKTNITDEIGVISSLAMVKEVVKKLDLRVSYYSENPKDKKKEEMYGTGIPIQLDVDTLSRQVVNIPIRIKVLSKNEYRLIIESKGEELSILDPKRGRTIKGGSPDLNIRKTLRFGERYKDKRFSFRVLRTEFTDDSKITDLYAQINDLNSIAKRLAGKLRAKQKYLDSYIIGLNSEGSVPQKQIDFLNTLMEVFIEEDLRQKNLEGRQALEFIEGELGKADQALAQSEATLAQFKSQKAIVDQQVQSVSTTEVLENFELEKDKAERQLQGYSQILNLLKTSSSDDLTVIPANAGLSSDGQDVTLNGLLREWTTLNQEKAVAEDRVTRENPQWKNLDKQARNKKAIIINYVQENVKAIRNNMRSIDRQIARSEVKIKQSPTDSRELDDLQRRFDNDNKHYQFLLDKRTEAEIGLATNAPDSRVIDEARMLGKTPISPNKKLIYMIALFVAFVIPTGFILVASYLSDKVGSKADLNQTSSIPFLTTIVRDDAKIRKKKKDAAGIIPVVQRPKSLITESFRLLRIKIEDLNIYSNSKVIGVTSSIEGEGKTYCSVNLSAVYAMASYKTLLISADLYRPKVHRYFNYDQKSGLSDYLENKATLDSIIHQSALENLDVMVAGQHSTNPSELLSMQKIGVLLDELRRVYQCIIIDTPPTEYVSDYFVLKNYLDVTLYLVRYNYTRSKLLTNITELYEEDKVSNLYLVLNDVKYASIYDSQMKKKKNSYYHRDGNA